MSVVQVNAKMTLQLMSWLLKGHQTPLSEFSEADSYAMSQRKSGSILQKGVMIVCMCPELSRTQSNLYNTNGSLISFIEVLNEDRERTLLHPSGPR
jgi:hypothetical protein